MAIYRGAGGSTDTTDQATVTEVSQKAAEAATSATNAASSASEAATSASTASSSKTAAATSATNAAASASTASQKASEASAASTTAVAAQTAVEIMEASVESAESNAILYGNMANTAAGDATTAKNQAEAASISASTYATAAQTAEANVSVDADAAAASATAAATSETNAAASDTSAANSASSALLSAAAASTSETNAEASETAAAASQVAAAASESAAATSETNASASATASANSASAASTSASQASTSASNAATSETNAAASETAAASSASASAAARDAALEALDSFDDRYLGVKSSDPTLDNDGNALLAGALYYNDVDDVMKVYEGSQWLAAYASLSGALLVNNNLSDLNNAASARTNLGLGTAATTASTDYATAAQGALADSAIQASGDSMTGNLNFGDNDKAVFGAGSDLQIYHDGNNSTIADTGTGVLEIRTNGTETQITGNSGTDYSARFQSNGAVKLYNDGSQKLSTTATGVDVTGTVTADGLTVEIGAGSVYSGDIKNTSTATTDYNIVRYTQGAGSGAPSGIVGTAGSAAAFPFASSMVVGTQNSGAVTLLSNNKAVLRGANNGDISFYEDTGTTAKFFWDASAESLGIGTTSTTFSQSGASAGLNILGSGNSAEINLTRNGGATTSFMFVGANDSLSIGTDGAEDFLLSTNNLERMRIDSSGNVGIGTDSPSSPSGFARLAEISDASSASYVVDGAGTDLEMGASSFGAWLGTSDVSANKNLRLGTNGSERMRIDSSGYVGVGTSSPTELLHLYKSANTYIGMQNSTTGTSTSDGGYIGMAGTQMQVRSKENDAMTFWTTNSERMRIDSSGNVGIGTSSPSSYGKLAVAGTLATLPDNNGYALLAGRYSSGYPNATLNSIDGVPWVIQQGGSERMRIDSSGNLLVGGTSAYENGAVTITTSGQIYSSRTNVNPMDLNRNGTDGNIVQFAKDGTTVGSIGVDAGSNATSIYIGGNDTGLDFGARRNDVIAPMSPATGTYRDDAISLGGATERFKNLYLSGNITDGTNSVSVADLGGGGAASSTIQVFTSSGTWTRPTGCTKVRVTVTGGGGGGAGTANTEAVCAGGGAGGTAIEYIDVSGTASVSVTVGSGGAGQTGTGNGSNGSASSFGAFCTGNGGSGGTRSTSLATQATGNGGTATGGDLNITGGQSPTVPYIARSGGSGGASVWGSGSSGWTVGSNQTVTAATASVYGSGGGGVGATGTVNTNGNGGAGAAGVVVVEEWY